MITIHLNFTEGDEVSYYQGLIKHDDFTTCCLDFFDQDFSQEVVILIRKYNHKNKGEYQTFYISKNHIQEHTSKEIRKVHNIHKMFHSGAFEWKEYNEESINKLKNK